MGGNDLRHLAVLTAHAPDTAGGPAEAVADAARRAGVLAEEAFARVPGLRAFSFVARGIDRLLDQPAGAQEALRGCVAAAGLLETAAARCGAALRLCGRTDGLPRELTRHAPPRTPVAAHRTLLWYLRYGGRDEIARAASRFLQERPAATLADEDLDAWLDTAGVPDPDLIVLVGGPFEVQDALLWQGSYAEFWHTAIPWAAFTGEVLARAVADYSSRQRRFGG